MFEDLIFDNKDGLSGRKKESHTEYQDPRFDKDTSTLPATEVKGEEYSFNLMMKNYQGGRRLLR